MFIDADHTQDVGLRPTMQYDTKKVLLHLWRTFVSFILLSTADIFHDTWDVL